MGPRSRHTAQEVDVFSLLEINVLWCENCKSIPEQQQAKDLVKMLEETGTKVSLSTVKRVLFRHNLKGHSARKKPLLQNHHKKARLRFATAHGEMSSGLIKQKYNCLARMVSSLCLEEKGRDLQAKENHPNCEARGWQHHVVGVLCCRRDSCTSQKMAT